MKKLFLLSIFYVGLGFSSIKEVSSLESMNDHKEEGVLFLYDLDNTLIQLAQMFGCNQWFQYRKGQLKKEGIESSVALEIALKEWIAAQYASEVKVIEKEAPKIIRDQQSEGVQLIGFTTRDHIMTRCTKNQLSTLGIDLSVTAPKVTGKIVNDNIEILYRNGVLFTAGTHKGRALFAFLEKGDLHPKSIVFINDKAQNLAQVEETCEERGMPFTGLRYNYLDQYVSEFNTEIADMQRKTFLSIPSDNACLAATK